MYEHADHPIQWQLQSSSIRRLGLLVKTIVLKQRLLSNASFLQAGTKWLRRGEILVSRYLIPAGKTLTFAGKKHIRSRGVSLLNLTLVFVYNINSVDLVAVLDLLASRKMCTVCAPDVPFDGHQEQLYIIIKEGKRMIQRTRFASHNQSIGRFINLFCLYQHFPKALCMCLHRPS